MSQHQPAVGADEYISPEDGLIHCAVCHQARQAWVRVVEPPFLARTPCVPASSRRSASGRSGTGTRTFSPS